MEQTNNNDRLRLTTDDIGDWFAPAGFAFLYDVYAVVIYLDQGARRRGDAIHLKVSASDVRQAAAFAEEYLKQSGQLMPGSIFRVAEVMIDLKPAENEYLVRWMELKASLPLGFRSLHTMNLIVDGLGKSRPLGMPDPIKDGNPDEPAAIATAHQTAEYVAFIDQQSAMWEAQRAGRAYANGQGDKKKSDAAQRAFEKAAAEFARLRANPAEGLRIVRDALSIDERIAEQNSISHERSSAADGGRERNQ